jgi:copper resistance protein C
MTRRGGRVRALVAASGLALAISVAGATPAAAHNYLVSSTPEAGTTVSDIPEFVVSVTTNEPLLDVSGEAAGFALQVSDSAGAYYGDGCLAVEGATLSTRAELGAAGEYTVGWQVVSTDGHTVDGSFQFTWEPPNDYVPMTGVAEPPACESDGSAATPPAGAAEEPGSSAATGGTDVLWVLGSIVAVAIVLFGTLLFLTRRRGGSSPKR